MPISAVERGKCCLPCSERVPTVVFECVQGAILAPLLEHLCCALFPTYRPRYVPERCSQHQSLLTSTTCPKQPAWTVTIVAFGKFLALYLSRTSMRHRNGTLREVSLRTDRLRKGVGDLQA